MYFEKSVNKANTAQSITSHIYQGISWPFLLGLALGEKCSADAKCLDDNAFCDPIDGVCECVPGTFESETTGMCEDGTSMQ